MLHSAGKVFAQDEEGNVTDEVIKRTYDLKCQRQDVQSQSASRRKPEKKIFSTMRL